MLHPYYMWEMTKPCFICKHFALTKSTFTRKRSDYNRTAYTFLKPATLRTTWLSTVECNITECNATFMLRSNQTSSICLQTSINRALNNGAVPNESALHTTRSQTNIVHTYTQIVTIIHISSIISARVHSQRSIVSK